MWPWGHVAVGYLLYSLGLRQRNQLPRSPEVFLLGFGTLFPDLVDKPLAWTLGVLESGRSLGHSVVVAAVVIGVLYLVVAPRVGRAPVTAFAVGYLSHPLADFPYAEVAAGELEFTTYLVWPLLSPPPYETEPSFLAHLVAYEFGPFEAVQLGLFAAAVYLWSRDGTPGLGAVRKTARRLAPR